MTKREEAYNEILKLTANDFKHEDFVTLYKYARRWFIEDKDYSSPMGKIYKAADRFTFYEVAERLRKDQTGAFKNYNEYSIKQAAKLTNLKQLCTFMKRIKDSNELNEAVINWLDAIKKNIKSALDFEASWKERCKQKKCNF